MQFSVLTFNAGLFEIGACGLTIRPADYIEERAAHLNGALLKLKADIVLLQEVFRSEHRQHVSAGMAQVYPHQFVHQSSRRWPNQGHGLMVLSKYPLTSAEFIPFTQSILLERVAMRKGFIRAMVTLPIVGAFQLANVHTVAGTEPESCDIEDVRDAQLGQVAETLRDAHTFAILAGDLNAGPQASACNYWHVREQGYDDSFSEDQAPGVQTVTWDPNNPLNQNGPHKQCPPQKCDHVLYRPGDTSVSVRTSKVVLNEPVVPIGDHTVTLSDHYGLYTEFKLA